MDESSVINVILRPFDEALDQGMIYSRWRNYSFYSALIKPEQENTEYFKEKTKKIHHILKQATVKIACLESCPMVIIGFSVQTGPHLHFIYVKPEWRKQGIGTLLFPKEIQTVSSELTKIGSDILNKKKNWEIKNDCESN